MRTLPSDGGRWAPPPAHIQHSQGNLRLALVRPFTSPALPPAHPPRGRPDGIMARHTALRGTILRLHSLISVPGTRGSMMCRSSASISTVTSVDAPASSTLPTESVNR